MYDSVRGWASVSAFRSSEASRAFTLLPNFSDMRANAAMVKQMAAEKKNREEFIDGLPPTRIVRKYR